MSAERRFNEKEVTAIFEQATRAQQAAQQHAVNGEGLTLAELQQIGREAGITPEFIARAAATVEQGGSAQPPATRMGLPISVSRTVDLPGPLSEEAWDRLVVDLRETFNARGRIRRDGSLREWSNGNLRAMLEPTENGHRLRLRTLKGSAEGTIYGEIALIAIGVCFLLVMGLSDSFEPTSLQMGVMGLLTMLGLGGFGATAGRLRNWAEERERQMEAIAARAVDLAHAPISVPAHREEPVLARDLDLGSFQDAEEAPPARNPRRTRG
jgi:hypothetical protein